MADCRDEQRPVAVTYDLARLQGLTGVGPMLCTLNGRATDILSSRLESLDLTKYLPKMRSYPGFFPLLHLDHIYYKGRVEVLHVELVRTRQALMASDHLPLVADLRITY